jgi:hypothetical protein
MPRSVGGLIADTFGLYRRYPLLFFLLAAAVIVPYQLIVLAAMGTGPLTQSLSASAGLLLLLVDSALVVPLVSSLHIHAVAEARLGGAPELGPVVRQGVRALPVVAAASVMSWLGITLGFFALFIPGLLLTLRWVVVAQAAALEREGWLPALGRSADLARGRYWHVLFFLVLVGAITVVPTLLVGMLFGEETTALSFVGGLALQILLASFAALATALLYFDLRARLEAMPVATAVPSSTSNLAPPEREQRAWDPNAYSDQDRPRGWFVDPDSPRRMRYWGAEAPPSWTGSMRTPRKVRREWERESEE